MKYYELPESIDDDIAKYQQLIAGYKQKEISKTKLKVFRVPMGVYEQRDSETYMIRIRIPAGAVTPRQFSRVAEIAENFKKYTVHLTTRQEFQIHNLELEETIKVMKQLKEYGLSSRGGGGNTVRNIIGSYDTGIGEEEVFDITPYVTALTTRMISEPDSWTLPRKFKIAFSSSENDTGLATINDLGFIAKKKSDGHKGFSVYIAGGMGIKPRPGLRLFDFIPENEVYNIAKAAKNLFDRNGNRKNKYRARLRFLLESLGEDEFKKKFFEELESVRKLSYLPLQINVLPEIEKGQIVIPVILGDISTENMKKIGYIMSEYNEYSIRLTPTQNILLRNIPADRVPELKQRLIEENILKDYSPVVYNGTVCAGASTCKLGICLSRGLYKEIKEKIESSGISNTNISDLSIKISGCPNTCGHHIIADIGFYGSAKRINNRLVPYYTLMAGGIVEENKTELAEKAAELPAKTVPDFLIDFLREVDKYRKENEPFRNFLKRTGFEIINKLSEKYSDVPDFEVDDKYYYDWSSDKIFSLADKIEGECSAGLFDLIDWDFENIKNYLSQLRTEKDNETIQELTASVVVSSCRALLITKGLEPGTEKEAVELFKKNFIGNHISTDYLNVINKYLNKERISIKKAEDLANAVKNLYNNMDNSLRFPNVEDSRDESEKSGTSEKSEHHFKDFRGVTCPMNFVKTKLVLESMNQGELLEVLLDDGAPIENVPASVAGEGHKIIDKQRKDNYWSVLIRKK